MLGSQEVRQPGSLEELRIYSKPGLHLDSRPTAPQMCDLGHAPALSRPHLTHLQSGLWNFIPHRASMHVKPEAKCQAQRTCSAQVTSYNRVSPVSTARWATARHVGWFSSPTWQAPETQK